MMGTENNFAAAHADEWTSGHWTTYFFQLSWSQNKKKMVSGKFLNTSEYFFSKTQLLIQSCGDNFSKSSFHSEGDTRQPKDHWQDMIEF